MLSVSLFGGAFTRRNDTFETLLKGAATVDDILFMLVHYIHH